MAPSRSALRLLSLVLTALFTSSTTLALSIPQIPYEPNTHTHLPFTHFGHVFSSNLTLTGACGWTSPPSSDLSTREIGPDYQPSDGEPTRPPPSIQASTLPSNMATRWIALSPAYGTSYCGKTVVMASNVDDNRLARLTVVDICEDCYAEDVLVGELWFSFLFEDDIRAVRRGRKFAPRWWFEGDNDIAGGGAVEL
ncbi:hypothetical protein MKZ38_008113 [Zalerion maritima]|uniref:Uncharacterized protein n=1 Tax=Zalerion maritima TaxID=339359 RepID=A0AAD5WU12_9PEZI|nr:hypothetical protein MKZ38_008113 [Zalerion maritima]